MQRRTLAAILGGLVLALALPTLASANPVAGNFVYGIGSNLSLQTTQTAQRDQVVILQVWKTDLARQMKAENPNITLLAYEDLSSMAKGPRSNGMTSSGVGFDEADSQHEDWFLHDKSGKRVAESGYSWLWMADIGNSGYQQRWADNVVSNLRNGPWDGVFADDTNTTDKYYVNPSSIPQYPNDSAYQGATRSMLAAVSPKLHSGGYKMYANLGAWVEYPNVVKDWLQFLDGGMDEMFGKYSTGVGAGYRDPAQWKIQQGEIATTESMGKRYLSVTQAMASDTQAQRFGWASTLLAAQGNTSYFANQDSQFETWLPDYDAQLGSPTSDATAVAGGAYKRTFTAGLVFANPTSNTVHVTFGGSYSGSGLTGATEADLPAHSGLVLTSPDAAKRAPVLRAPIEGESFPTPAGSGTRVVRDKHASKKHGIRFNHRHGSTSRRVRTRSKVTRVVVRAKAARCAAKTRLRVKVDGHTVLRRRVRGGYHNYRAKVRIRRGLHRVRISVSGSPRGCGTALTVDKITFVGKR